MWAYDIGRRDVGTLVFDGGAQHATKIVIRTDKKTGARFNKFTGRPFNSYRDLDGDLKIVETATADRSRILVHDETRADPSQAFALSRLTETGVLRQAPIGIFRRVSRPSYDDLLRDQIAAVRAEDTGAALAAVIAGQDTWEADER